MTRHTTLLLPFLVSGLLSPSCSPSKLIINRAADALGSGQTTVFTSDEDPVLVGEALPFALKVYESLIEKAPANAELRIATGRAFTLYAFGFVQLPSEALPPSQLEEKTLLRKRTQKLYLRARDYLLDALELRHPGFRDLVFNGSTDSALAHATAADTAALYYAGAAWAGALACGKPGLATALAMPRAVALVRKAYALNAGLDSGAIDEFFISYCASAPKSLGGGDDKAREHFSKAVERSLGRKAGPYVALASSVSLKRRDREELTDLLQKALAIDVSLPSRYRLLNVLNQQKARRLLQSICPTWPDCPEDAGP